MTKQLWLNLPVKDVAKSKSFFSAIGFSLHPRHSGNDAAGLIIGESNAMVMLFPEAVFRSFTRNGIADTKQGTEVLLSIDAASREEVDEIVRKAAEAGGIVYAQPGDQGGWMYGAGFADLDGHRWNVLYMDMDKMPKEG